MQLFDNNIIFALQSDLSECHQETREQHLNALNRFSEKLDSHGDTIQDLKGNKQHSQELDGPDVTLPLLYEEVVTLSLSLIHI